MREGEFRKSRLRMRLWRKRFPIRMMGAKVLLCASSRIFVFEKKGTA